MVKFDTVGKSLIIGILQSIICVVNEEIVDLKIKIYLTPPRQWWCKIQINYIYITQCMRSRNFFISPDWALCDRITLYVSRDKIKVSKFQRAQFLKRVLSLEYVFNSHAQLMVAACQVFSLKLRFFDENFDFRPKSRCLMKMLILVQKFDLRPKS